MYFVQTVSITMEDRKPKVNTIRVKLNFLSENFIIFFLAKQYRYNNLCLFILLECVLRMKMKRLFYTVI
jgi:hypothetical protein